MGGVTFLEEARCFDAQSGRISGSYNINHDDHRQRLTVKSKATFYSGRLWGVNHRVKTGLSIEGERYFRRLEEGTQIVFFVVDELNDPINPGQGSELDPRAIIIADISVPETDDVNATGTELGLLRRGSVQAATELDVDARGPDRSRGDQLGGA